MFQAVFLGFGFKVLDTRKDTEHWAMATARLLRVEHFVLEKYV